MSKKLILFVCLLFLAGCRQTNRNPKAIDYKQVDAVKTIKIDDIDENSVLKFSEIYDSMRFIKLETLDNCLIGYIDKIIATKDKFIILDSYKAKAIFVFDSNGTFLNRIGKNGYGPDEYDEPCDIAYDEYNDELLVLRDDRKTILIFKIDGTFAGKTIIERKINSLFVVDNNAYLSYLNNFNYANEDKKNYNINIFNKKGQLIQELMPINEETGHLFPPAPMFYYYNNEVIFAPFYSDIIYKYENKSITPKYLLDFGKWKIPDYLYKGKTDREFDEVIRNSNYVYNTASFETSSHVVCHFNYKQINYTCYYSKETETTKTSSVYFNDMYTLLSGQSKYYLKGDSLISFIESFSIDVYKEYINKMKIDNMDMNNTLLTHFIPILPDGKLKDVFFKIINTTKISFTDEEIDFTNSINEMDNPIIMLVKLKKF